MRQHEWQWIVIGAPWYLVELAAIVFAIVMLWSPRRRAPAICVLIAVGTAFILNLVKPFIYQALMNGALDFEDFESVQFSLELTSAFISAAAYGLLVFAAFAWRGDSRAISAGPAAVGYQPPTQDIHLPTPAMRPLSAPLRITLIVVPSLLSMILTIVGFVLAMQRRTEVAALLLLLLALMLMIVSMITMLTTLHALRKTIQPPPRGAGVEGGARCTPGRAVGFMFIPFFNIYWVFQAWWGWCKDCNKTLAARGLSGPYATSGSFASHRAPEGLALTMCILSVVSIIPYVGILIGLVNLIILPIMLWHAIGCANTLRTAGANSQPAMTSAA